MSADSIDLLNSRRDFSWLDNLTRETLSIVERILSIVVFAVLPAIGQPQNAALIRAKFAKEGWLGFLRLVTAENSPLRDSNNNWVVAKAYLDLGEKDKAFAELNKAYEIRLSSLCWLKVEPQMDPVRSDPRYQELLKKMGFPQ